MKRILGVLPFAYLLFRFYPVFFNHTLQVLLVFGGVMLYLAFRINLLLRQTVNRDIFINTMIMLVGIIVIAVAVPVLKGTGDYSYARKLLSEVLNIFCWLAFVVHVKTVASKNERNCVEEFVDEYTIILMMYIGFSLFCVLVPSFRSFWQTVVPLNAAERMNLTYTKYMGRLGWDGFAGYDSTFKCTLGVFFVIGLLSTKRIAGTSRTKLYFYLVVLLFGNFIYGRTGLFASVGMTGLFLIREAILKRNAVPLLIAITVLLAGIGLVIVLRNRSSVFETIFNWAFEPIINLLNGNGFTATSLTRLEEMHDVRPSLRSFLIGDGYYTDPVTRAYYQQVDVGYLRMFFFWGFLPTILVYLLAFRSARKSPFNSFFCLLLYLMLFIIFEYKGEIWRMMVVCLTPLTFLHDNVTPDRLCFRFLDEWSKGK